MKVINALSNFNACITEAVKLDAYDYVIYKDNYDIWLNRYYGCWFDKNGKEVDTIPVDWLLCSNLSLEVRDAK